MSATFNTINIRARVRCGWCMRVAVILAVLFDSERLLDWASRWAVKVEVIDG